MRDKDKGVFFSFFLRGDSFGEGGINNLINVGFGIGIRIKIEG